MTASLISGTLATGILAAGPRLEDVFKSTNQELGGGTDPTKLLAVICAIGGAIVLLVFLSRRRKTSPGATSPRTLHHQGKLIREVQKAVHLKPAEIRQLKTLADSQGVQNPLTLLLCPSLLAKAAKERPDKLDRRVVSGMIKRMT
jgi:hypothetical protein